MNGNKCAYSCLHTTTRTFGYWLAMKKTNRLLGELIWFWNHLDAAIGNSSTHPSFSSALHIGILDDPYTDGMLRTISKARRIRTKLYSLPTNQRRILEATHNLEYRYSPTLTATYGVLAGAVLFNTYLTEYDDLIALCSKKLRKSLSATEQQISFQIGIQAHKLYEEALHAYSLAKY